MTLKIAHRASALFLAALVALGCSDSTAPATGSITVTVATQGVSADLDPNGYTLSIDGGTPEAIAINGTATISDLPTGSHSVRLDGLAPNCSVSGTNPRSVDVIASDQTPSPASVTFSVLCTVRTGIFRVSASTSGTDIDSDGYVVFVRGVERGRIAPNGTLEIAGLPPGPTVVELYGVSGNCVVEGSNLQPVTLGFGGTGQHAFVIRCVQSGLLKVTATTTGVEPDRDGYYVVAQLQAADSRFTWGSVVGPNGTATLPPLLPGSYLLTVYDIAPNCDAVLPNPRVVVLSAGQTAIEVNVACEAPRELAVVYGGANKDIWVVNPNGNGSSRLTDDAAADVDPAWSPDGRRIAFASQRDGNFEIYVMNVGTSPVRLTNASGADNRPSWSPDGSRIAFASHRDGNWEIYVMNSDGSNQVRITNNAAFDGDPAWSPDGSQIAFTSARGDGGIWVMNADGSAPRRLTSNSRGDGQPAWSPDGTRIAFARQTSNSRDIFIVNTDGSALTQLTQNLEHASDPAWSPDGRKIALSEQSYYDDIGIMIVSLLGVPYSYDSSVTPAYDPAWRP